MIIQLKKFGTILLSRPSGKEAWLAFQPVLNGISVEEEIIADFAEVVVLTPSWVDEFITPLYKRFDGRVRLLNIIDNASIKASLAMIGK